VNGLNILVVAGSRSLAPLEETLRAQGHAVVSARDAPEALREIRERPPHLVICAIDMPGMDGLRILRELAADPRGAVLPVMLATAGAAELIVGRPRACASS